MPEAYHYYCPVYKTISAKAAISSYVSCPSPSRVKSRPVEAQAGRLLRPMEAVHSNGGICRTFQELIKDR